jgi:hypothetical protein
MPRDRTQSVCNAMDLTPLSTSCGRPLLQSLLRPQSLRDLAVGGQECPHYRKRYYGRPDTPVRPLSARPTVTPEHAAFSPIEHDNPLDNLNDVGATCSRISRRTPIGPKVACRRRQRRKWLKSGTLALNSGSWIKTSGAHTCRANTRNHCWHDSKMMLRAMRRQS